MKEQDGWPGITKRYATLYCLQEIHLYKDRSMLKAKGLKTIYCENSKFILLVRM